jgi:hypothetical protein
MEKRQMPYYVFRLKVDDKGRLKLPPEVRQALGDKQDLAVVSDAPHMVRLYPLNNTISRRMVFGRRPAVSGKVSGMWGRLALATEQADSPLPLEARTSCFVTTIDAQGRAVIAPHQGRQRSDVELENEEVYLRWHYDHFLVTTSRH